MDALIFPGQGAQQVGMGSDAVSAFPAAKKAFEEADEALGFRLSDLIFHGPESELTLTANTQPAILTTGVALYRALTVDLGVDLKPAFVAGHSLGEHTALVASGALSLGNGVRLVRRRGELMQQAVPAGQGAMAAVLGLEDEAVEQVCRDVSGLCEPANYNCPKQLVISGEKAAVEEACQLAKERGAKRAMALNVSAPFHCSLMKPVAEPLFELIQTLTWHEPFCPLVANVTAQPVTDLKTIAEGLRLQTYSPVLWTQSVQAMARAGVTRFIEFGPGKVLSGMVKKIVKEAEVVSLENAEALKAFAQECR